MDASLTPRSELATLPVVISRRPWLPPDLQLMILEMLAQDPGCDRSGTTCVKKGLARYAAVCKHWQTFCEKRLYRHLTLSQSCLNALDTVVRRQRGLVKHIWLRIELLPYDCPDCMKFVSKRTRDHDIAGNAITKLFHVLSTWRKSEPATYRGLTLEISIYSPSDVGHNFGGDFHFGPEPFETDNDMARRLHVHDPYHGWHQGKRSDRPIFTSIDKLLEGVLPCCEKLPSVEVVDNLVLRRQTRRHLDGRTLRAMFRSLPNLTRVTYEPWRDFLRFRSKPDLYHRDPGEFHAKESCLLKSSGVPLTALKWQRSGTLS